MVLPTKMNKLYFYIGVGVVGVLILGGVWFLFFAGSGSNTTNTPGVNFGAGDNRAVTVTETTPVPSEPTAEDNSSATSKVFKIVDGPVAGAALMQVGHPTTTVARFVMADSGHVFDLPLDSPGAVARAVSNTTVPGIVATALESQGSGAEFQYIDSNVIKTLHVAFPAATTTLGNQQPVKIQFLPNGITSFAISPDSKSVAYLLKTTTGSDGYIANVDGGSSKKVFSLPLTQLTLSWPAQSTVLAQSAPAAGVAGVVFSIDAKSGATAPLIYATGLSAIADRGFSKVVYQSTAGNTQSASTYVRDTTTGLNTALSLDPYPEKCLWSYTSSSTLYCAAPLTYVAPNYLDLWHAGVASAADSIFAFDVNRGTTHIIASPGSKDGGSQADIAEMALSVDDSYLLFIRKGDRSLWGVRLNQN